MSLNKIGYCDVWRDVPHEEMHRGTGVLIHNCKNFQPIEGRDPKEPHQEEGHVENEQP